MAKKGFREATETDFEVFSDIIASEARRYPEIVDRVAIRGMAMDECNKHQIDWFSTKERRSVIERIVDLVIKRL